MVSFSLKVTDFFQSQLNFFQCTIAIWEKKGQEQNFSLEKQSLGNKIIALLKDSQQRLFSNS